MFQNLPDKILFADKGHLNGLVWYRNPNWREQSISKVDAIHTDIEISDIDKDCLADIVALIDNGI